MELRRLATYGVAVLGVAGLGALLHASLDEGGDAAPPPAGATRGASPGAPPRWAATAGPERPPAPAPPAVTAAAAPLAASEPDAPTLGFAGVHGTVYLPDGRVAAGATVRWEERGLSTVSDAQGRYRLRWPATAEAAAGPMPAGLSFEDAPVELSETELTASSADGSCRAQTWAELPLVAREDELDLVLVPWTELVLIVDPPQAYVEAWLFPLHDPADEHLLLPDDALNYSLAAPEEGELLPRRLDELFPPGELEPGRYLIRVECWTDERVGYSSATTTLTAGGRHEVRVQPRPLAQVELELRHQGAPARGQVLVSYPPEAGPARPVAFGKREEELVFEEVSDADADASGSFQFALDPLTHASDDRGRLTVELPPGRWRLQALIDGVAGRAERVIEVRDGPGQRHVLEVQRGRSATVRYPVHPHGTELAVFGPPGLSWAPGRAPGEVLVEGLLPGDEGLVCAQQVGEEYDYAAVARVRAEAQVELAPAKVAYLELSLETAFGEEHAGSVKLRVEHLDGPPLPPAPFATVLEDEGSLWDPETTRYVDLIELDPGDHELEGGFRTHFVLPLPLYGWNESFALLPGRYRVTLEGWGEPRVRELVLSPGEERRVEFRLP